MDWALESTNEYQFNELFLDAFFDNAIPFTSAFEEAGTTTNASQANTSNTNGSTVTTNSDSNNTANPKGDEKQTPEEAKEASGIIEKIKQLFARLMEIAAQAMTNFKSKFVYFANKKKEFEKELYDLEKKYTPRFDVIKKNRKYDYSCAEFGKFLNICGSVLTQDWQPDMNTIIDGYKKVSSDDSASEEDFNKTTENISNKEVHKNTIKYIASKMGPAYNKIENFSQLTKAIQVAQRGGTPGSLEEPESEEMTIDQTVYNNARRCVTICDKLLKAAHQQTDKLNAELKAITNKAKMINNTNKIKGVQKSVTVMTKISKEVNTLLSLNNFGVALLIETMTNATFVCKACLVGGNNAK